MRDVRRVSGYGAELWPSLLALGKRRAAKFEYLLARAGEASAGLEGEALRLATNAAAMLDERLALCRVAGVLDVGALEALRTRHRDVLRRLADLRLAQQRNTHQREQANAELESLRQDLQRCLVRQEKWKFLIENIYVE